MKRLIRNKLTGEYFTRNGTWTKNIGSAQDFPNVRFIVDAEQEHSLQQFEVVLLASSRPGRYDVVIPWPIVT